MSGDEPKPLRQSDDLREREIRLETETDDKKLEKWIRRYKKRAQREAEWDFLFDVFQPMRKAVRSEQDRFRNRGRRVPAFASVLRRFDADELAFIALDSIFNAIMIRGVDDGQAPCEAEITADIRRRCRLGWSLQHRKTLGAARLDLRDGRRDGRWYQLGFFLLTLAVDHAVTYDGVKLFERTKTFETEGDKAKPGKVVVRLSADAQQKFLSRMAWIACLAQPSYRPMVAKPDPWRKSEGNIGIATGGYLGRRQFDLVKRAANSRIREALQSADLSVVFQAINALQDTPWRINRGIYETVREALDRGLDLPGLVSDGGIGDSVNPSARTNSPSAKWRNAQRGLMEAENAKRQGQLLLLQERMEVCKDFLDETFYFPYSLDHRGRAYPIPRALHPQSDDLGRALLRFADGKPLGRPGAFWLSVHLANLAGLDKEPLDKRADWVREHETEISDFASAPLRDPHHPFWTIDEKPWSLLAACKEWVAYQKGGLGTLSYLPILMDGTCNGLQHLSAMGRDLPGGEWTNLVPSGAPKDIYQEVADRVILKVQHEADKGDPRAKEWVGRITRKTAKRATMNKPYSITPRGIQEALVHEKHADHCANAWDGALYLAGLLDGCVKEVVAKAVEIMKKLREMAQELAKANRGLKWTTPSGFVVVHEERAPKIRRIELPYATGSGPITIRTVRIAEDGGGRQRLNKTKQRNGIAPNFVHSMDAAHMMRTICGLHSEGCGHFAAIHDGYGVHACDVDLMNRLLREEFVKIYQEPVLERFWEEQRRANPNVRLPDPPETGDLDISVVLKSEYFFC